jgi:nitrite reductase (NADH) small subunit
VTWTPILTLDRLEADRGACALVGDLQIAVFRLSSSDQLFAIDNFDPFSGVACLSRGVVGDDAGRPKVSSPVYKQSFDLATGRCFDDDAVSVAVYPVRVVGGVVEVEV